MNMNNKCMNNKYKNKRGKINFINQNNYKPNLLVKSVITEKKEECTICFEDCNTINKDIGLNKLECYCHCNCKYYVHVPCLSKWITVKPNCLMCKQKIYSFNTPLAITNAPTVQSQMQRVIVDLENTQITIHSRYYRYCRKAVIFTTMIVMTFSYVYVILYTCFVAFYIIINFNSMYARHR